MDKLSEKRRKVVIIRPIRISLAGSTHLSQVRQDLFRKRI